MADGSGDDSAEGGRADEGAILSPHELDITDSEYVEEIDDGRFVVSPDARTGKGQAASGGQPQGGGTQRRSNDQRQSGPQPGDGGGRAGGNAGGQSGGANSRQSASRGGGGRRNRQPQGDITEEEVRQWLRRKYERSNSKYAFDVTAQFEGKVSQRRLASNDLITVFESLMLWYAQQVDGSMPVEEVLGILLMESNVPVRYPPESVRNLVKSTNLGPEDTIADLLEAVQNEDGVQL
jgi:hypothetical protein